MMGVMYDDRGNFEAALQEFNKAAQLDVHSVDVHLRLALDYIRLSRPGEAIAQLKTVVTLEPEYLEAHTLLALLYSSVGQIDDAVREYEIALRKASQIAPQNIDIYRGLAQVYLQEKKYGPAMEACNAVLRIAPDDADTLFLLGFLYEETSRHKEAAREFKKALKARPDFPEALNSLGYLYAEDGINLDEAETLIKKALASDAQNGAYIDSLGWVYYKKGKVDEALAQLEKAVRLYPDPEIYGHLIEAYTKKGLTEKAQEARSKLKELQGKKK